tara:strand:- start:3214 stop:3624 length:411 start_codon:yes stop_codon:yes gene_type:complete
MYQNNYKKWSNDDMIIFNNYIKNNSTISHNDIVNIASTLKRTENAIIFRLFKIYISNEYDFLYNDNENLYNRYKFFSKKNIDNFLIQNFTKKQKKLFKLNKINSIVLNLITYENNNCINEYNSIIDTIKDIYTIDK